MASDWSTRTIVACDACTAHDGGPHPRPVRAAEDGGASGASARRLRPGGEGEQKATTFPWQWGRRPGDGMGRSPRGGEPGRRSADLT